VLDELRFASVDIAARNCTSMDRDRDIESPYRSGLGDFD